MIYNNSVQHSTKMTTIISEFILFCLHIFICDRSPLCIPSLRIRVCTCSNRNGNIHPQFLRSSSFYLKYKVFILKNFPPLLISHRNPFHDHSPCSWRDPSRTCSNGTGSRSPSQYRRCLRRGRPRVHNRPRIHLPGTFIRHQRDLLITWWRENLSPKGGVHRRYGDADKEGHNKFVHGLCLLRDDRLTQGAGGGVFIPGVVWWWLSLMWVSLVMSSPGESRSRSGRDTPETLDTTYYSQRVPCV